MLTWLKRIGMRRSAVFKRKDEFVARSVKRTHAAIIFNPYNEVFKLGINRASGRLDFVNMALAHTNKMDRAAVQQLILRFPAHSSLPQHAV